MIVESHWRKIKHDYLHRFNRPRIDLVIWILLSRLIPSALTRMHALLQRDHRRATACWRKDFKSEWKRLNDKLSNPVHVHQYHTDPVRWTCACPYFLSSRFLFCKHILSCYERISDPVNFFRSVQRRRNFPFWTHQHLVLQPEYQLSEAKSADEAVNCDDGNDGNDGDEEDIDPISVMEDQLVDLEEDDDDIEDIERFASDMQSAMDIFREQLADGNDKFVRKFMAANASNRTLVQEVKTLQNQRTMPRTWNAWKHPATMYYHKRRI